jgi:hypothetical protein
VAEELIAETFPEAPSTRPAMSMNSMVVGTRLLGWMSSSMCRSSGTVTTPVLGSMVQKG